MTKTNPRISRWQGYLFRSSVSRFVRSNGIMFDHRAKGKRVAQRENMELCEQTNLESVSAIMWAVCRGYTLSDDDHTSIDEVHT